MAIELSLIRMLHSAQSHLNLVRVADLDIILFHCHFQWCVWFPVTLSTVILNGQIPSSSHHRAYLQKNCCNPVAVSLILILFLALGFTQLWAIYCLPLIASFCLHSDVSREKEKLFHAARQFYFTILLPSLSHIALHFVLLKGRQ